MLYAQGHTGVHGIWFIPSELKMLSWNLWVSLSKKIKPHTTLNTLCFALFQTAVRGCRNGHPL